MRRRRIGILFVAIFVSMFGVASCAGVEEQVQEQVEQEVHGVQKQAEEAGQGGRTQMEEEIGLHA